MLRRASKLHAILRLMNPSKKGFTLIELLVVISIIGLLSSVVLVSLNTARARARDAERLSALREVQKSLELYHLVNNSYPSTGGAWYGSSPNCYGGYGNNAIPGLVPTYISAVPLEVRPTTQACYLYNSNGTDFKFMAHQSMETCSAGSCKLQDPARTSQTSSSVYSPGYQGI